MSGKQKSIFRAHVKDEHTRRGSWNVCFHKHTDDVRHQNTSEEARHTKPSSICREIKYWSQWEMTWNLSVFSIQNIFFYLIYSTALMSYCSIDSTRTRVYFLLQRQSNDHNDVCVCVLFCSVFIYLSFLCWGNAAVPLARPGAAGEPRAPSPGSASGSWSDPGLVDAASSGVVLWSHRPSPPHTTTAASSGFV